MNKDPVMLAYMARQRDLRATVIETARERNLSMPKHMISLVVSAFSEMGKEIDGSRVAVLGMAFKDETDDIRNTVAGPIVTGLHDLGARVVVHDPHVRFETARRAFEHAHVAKEPHEALRGADCLVIVTDHKQFRNLRVGEIKELLNRPAAIVDGRHIFDPKDVLEHGMTYRGVGRTT